MGKMQNNQQENPRQDLVVEHLGGVCHVPLSVSLHVQVGAGVLWVQRGASRRGQNLGLEVLEGEQLPGSMGKMPAFTLAKEAVPSSAGYVNTGWVCAG